MHALYKSGLLALLILVTACGTPIGIPVETGQPTTSEPVDAEASPEPTTAAPPTPTSEPLAAQVNGQPVSMAAYERQVARYSTSMAAAGQDLDTPEGQQILAEGRQWVLNLMIEQLLIEQQAAQARSGGRRERTWTPPSPNCALISATRRFEQWLLMKICRLRNARATTWRI